MSLQIENKLMKLLEQWPPGTVATTTWLKGQGISGQLLSKYKQSGWVQPVGYGAFKRPGQVIRWPGALHAIQHQLNLQIHIGALTAITHRGAGHYVRMGKNTLYLFSQENIKLPAWFWNQNWSLVVEHKTTRMLPGRVGIKEFDIEGFRLATSSLERAVLETLYLSPGSVDLVEAYHIVEGLFTLRPALVQNLLESCSSIKVKRLFLFMADKASLPVFKHLNLEKLDLGRGDRILVENGAYVAKYKLSVPKELAWHD